MSTVQATRNYEIDPTWSRDRKIATLLPIARALSAIAAHHPSEVAFACLDAEDVYAIAAAAIIEAVDSFDPSFQTRIATYATNKARWAVAEMVRTCAPTPRSYLARGMSVRWHLFGSDALGAQALRSLQEHATSLEEDVCEIVMAREERARLRRYIEDLPLLERRALTLYLSETRTLREVGEELQLQDRRIYYVVERAIQRLRRMHHQTMLEDSRFNPHIAD